MKSLHDEIMNLKIDEDFSPDFRSGFYVATKKAALVALEHGALMGELLETLETLLEDYKNACNEWVDDAQVYGLELIDMAEKAIAKAKGLTND